MVYELVAYNTDSRYDDVRWREYTTSEAKADSFARIPKLQFTDSGHGIVFSSREVAVGAKRRPTVTTLFEYVQKHWHEQKDKGTLIDDLREMEDQINGLKAICSKQHAAIIAVRDAVAGNEL